MTKSMEPVTSCNKVAVTHNELSGYYEPPKYRGMHETKKATTQKSKPTPGGKFFNLWKKKDSDDLLVKIAELYRQTYDPYGTPITNTETLLETSYKVVYTDIDGYSEWYRGHAIQQARWKRQFNALYQKNADFGDPDQKKCNALRRFIESERACYDTYIRLKTPSVYGEVSSVLYHTQTLITRILGDVPALKDLGFRFTTGANTNTVGSKTSARHKLHAMPSVSRDALPSLQEFFETVPWYNFAHFGEVIISLGRGAFVPKNLDTDRFIMVEPIINTAEQVQIGSYIKKALYAFGCNLYSQERNRGLAQRGSVNKRLATVDLKMASDMIACAAVLDTFPMNWVEFLSTWRTGSMYFEGHEESPIQLWKFSSMGNGFTFELESLLFFSIAKSCCKVLCIPSDDVSVYGDDIIIPVEAVPLLKGVLARLGFVINDTKSYWSSSFRESCGVDMYDGVDIRPFYFKDRITTARLVGFLNFLKRRGDPMYHKIRELFDVHLTDVHRGPDLVGDGHLVEQYEPILTDKMISDGWSGHLYYSVVKKPTNYDSSLHIGDRLYPLYKAAAGNPYVSVSANDPRDLNCNFNGKERTYDVRGLGFYRSIPVSSSQAAISALDDDPYVLRGSEISESKRIYTLNSVPDLDPGWVDLIYDMARYLVIPGYRYERCKPEAAKRTNVRKA